VWISKNTLKQLSDDIRKIIDGQAIDLRDNRENNWSMLKNDIHTLAYIKNEQVDALQYERDLMKETLANISHQLKTPLTSMNIMADLLENELAEEEVPEKQIEFLANIKLGLTRMDWLVSALLKIAKLDAGAIEFTKNKIKAGELIRIALKPLDIMLDIKNQEVKFEGAAELFCDTRWTAEALTNVLKNASEYSPEGSVIKIEAGENPITKWISVTDSGEGISNAEMANLFKRYEGSRSDKGYGIGLPLALAIMRGQNGDVEVDGGGNGLGAKFTLKLYQ